jgi:hypothetical protein
MIVATARKKVALNAMAIMQATTAANKDDVSLIISKIVRQ